MSKKAFPRPGTTYSDSQSGMALRDWFAGQALAGLCAREPWPPVDGYARRAYDIADAFIAERDK